MKFNNNKEWGGICNIRQHGISGSKISHYYAKIKESEIFSPKFLFRFAAQKLRMMPIRYVK